MLIAWHGMASHAIHMLHDQNKVEVQLNHMIQTWVSDASDMKINAHINLNF